MTAHRELPQVEPAWTSDGHTLTLVVDDRRVWFKARCPHEGVACLAGRVTAECHQHPFGDRKGDECWIRVAFEVSNSVNLLDLERPVSPRAGTFPIQQRWDPDADADELARRPGTFLIRPLIADQDPPTPNLSAAQRRALEMIRDEDVHAPFPNKWHAPKRIAASTWVWLLRQSLIFVGDFKYEDGYPVGLTEFGERALKDCR